MRQFIYYDRDRVNSLYAQNPNGLVLAYEMTEGKEHTTESSKNTTLKGDVGAAAKVPYFGKGSAGVGLSHDRTKKDIDNEITTKLYTISQYDSILSKLHDYLKEEKLLNPKVTKTGSFVYGFERLHIIDLWDIESFLEASKNIFPIMNTAENDKEEYNKTKNTELEDTIIKIKALKSIVPYKTMALSPKGYLMPLEDKWIRDDSKLLGFKYGGSFHYIGYVTNIINLNTKVDSNKDISNIIQNAINQVLFKILPTDSKTIHVMHPLGIYFEP